MENTYWYKQLPDKPLFANLLWSRPENRQLAGKLLIIGGSKQGFTTVAESYSEAQRAGIGIIRVILPQALEQIVSKIFESGEYAPSTSSGGFAKKALASITDASEWSNGILITGNLGRSSETDVLLELLLQKVKLPITMVHNAIDYVMTTPRTALQRESTTLVLNISQLQRLAIALKLPNAITHGMDLLRLIDWLHTFTIKYSPNVITELNGIILVAVSGNVSTTKKVINNPDWRIKTAAWASVWWLQNITQPFEALSTAIIPME